MLHFPFEYNTPAAYTDWLASDLNSNELNCEIVMVPIRPRANVAQYPGLHRRYFADQLVQYTRTQVLDWSKVKIIVDDFTEATQDSTLNEIVEGILESFPQIKLENIIFVQAGVPSGKTVVQSLVYPTFLLEIFYARRLLGFLEVKIPWQNRKLKFISLCRRPTWFRVAITEEILSRNLDSQGIVTCGSESDLNYDQTEWKTAYLKDQKFYDRFPILFNGTAISGGEEQYDIQQEFTNCFVNVVSETSNQRYLGSAHLTGRPEDPVHHWDRIFITEKSMKPYFKEQVPLFNTMPGHVANMRSLGIDVFDDIVNHSYDLIDDKDQRLKAIADELERLCSISTEDWQTMYKSHNLESRFELARQAIMSSGVQQRDACYEEIKKFLRT
jgi:hypothetical protein